MQHGKLLIVFYLNIYKGQITFNKQILNIQIRCQANAPKNHSGAVQAGRQPNNTKLVVFETAIFLHSQTAAATHTTTTTACVASVTVIVEFNGIWLKRSCSTVI